MTAICKTIDIHGGLGKLLDYGSNESKTSLKNHNLQNALDYAKNPLKTILELDDGDKSMLVTGILCTPETAEEEFSLIREKYQETNGREYTAPFIFKDKKTGQSRVVQKEPVTAVHMIQSFSETDLDPRSVHQIGVELCERMGWQAVVDTHMNTGHFHNHIIINAYLPSGDRKVSMDKTTLLSVRQLSDDIQREYGLDIAFLDPEQQLHRSERSLNYREWDMKKKNLSWKDQIRKDMLAARHVSETRDDFIEIMHSYGYAIERQTDDSILWWNKHHTKKIWDHTLGSEYRINHLLENEDPVVAVITEKERNDFRKQTHFISVSRYSWDGKRRSDLEMIIRKAISFIQKVKNFYETAGISYDYHASRKLDILQETLDVLKETQIDSVDELHDQMNAIGAELNHTKKELRTSQSQKSYYDDVLKLISEYEEAQTIYKSVQYWSQPHSSLHIPSYSQEDIQRHRAELSPITPSQKRDLYLAMKKHPELRLKNVEKGYANISSMDAEAILKYFSGKAERPDILVSTDEYYYLQMQNITNTDKDQKSIQTNNKAFQKEISAETPRKQAVLTQLRNRTLALQKLGYDTKDLSPIKAEITSFYENYEKLSEKKANLSQQYKKLIRLKQHIHYAENEPFLYGPLLQEPKNTPEKSPVPTPAKRPDKDHLQPTENTPKKTLSQPHNVNMQNTNDNKAKKGPSYPRPDIHPDLYPTGSHYRHDPHPDLDTDPPL